MVDWRGGSSVAALSWLGLLSSPATNSIDDQGGDIRLQRQEADARLPVPGGTGSRPNLEMDVLAGAPAMPCDAAGPGARRWDNVPATASWRQRTLTTWMASTVLSTAARQTPGRRKAGLFTYAEGN